MEKSLEIHLAEQREAIAHTLEKERNNFVDSTPVAERGEAFLCGLGVFTTAILIVRGLA